MSHDVACRPTPQPARAPIPAGWRPWSHGNEAALFRTLLGMERPPAMILVERCCRGRGACANCRPAAIEPALQAV